MILRWIWVPFLSVCIGGCGSDDGGTGTTSTGGSGGSGGTTSGGTSGTGATGAIGGSGGTAGSGNTGGAPGGTGGISGSGNLGGAAGGGGIGGALNDACYEMCDQQETGEGCIPEYTATCKAGCNAVTPAYETKCPDVAKAYYDCNASIEYACFLALPVAKDPNACKAESDAFDASCK